MSYEKCRRGQHYENHDPETKVSKIISAYAKSNAVSIIDMDRFSGEEVLDCLQAIYKVQYKTFVAIVTTQVIKQQIARGLEKMFSPLVVDNEDAVRPPLAIPLTHKNNDQIAYFFHPAYPLPHDLLFTLPCVDPAGASAQPTGLHHTALLACQIIANNAFESGQLYFDRQGAHAVLERIPARAVLWPGEYFFVVNSDHGSLGRHDATLRALTNYGCGLTNAHIVPEEEGEWFTQNSMSRYGVDMRDPKFVPVGSDASSSTTNPAYVPRVFGTNMGEFSGLYHNTHFQCLDNTNREFISSRLAWTVLMLMKPFVLMDIQRSIIRCQSNQGAGVEWKVEDLSGPTLSSLYGGGGLRSVSPKKRSRQHVEDCSNVADSDEWYDKVFDDGRDENAVFPT
ncbi:uncharacterized protein BCR38DRAFT_480790 [Pseudomassariella vexata]|uniref:Uncharacterized protein n=1 Tax=Pseudomassariella vexata TaxID=1141098 RepID=A0A1Y2EDH1_9PEZI|nr:uncharacterized protein BCR38DRAFT_480790 [Pseudomassariella vexata]ORY69612.1 hypothetical protein BCR38DRAFT_480790 [Pseudomassariella vexata]